MSLGRYIEACAENESELRECLTKKDVDALRADYAESGLDGFLAWLNTALKEVRRYAESTVSQRTAKKKWQAPDIRRRLVLGSIWYVIRAQKMLEIIDEQQLEPGSSYRMTAGRAGRAYIDLVYGRSSNWPFDPPDPFEDNS